MKLKSVKPNMSNPVHFLAFGFGSGLMPVAPGTAGTLVAIIPWLWMSQQDLVTYLIILSIAVVLGIYFCGKTTNDLGVHDHPGIVWDEFCGFWLTMVAIPGTWKWLIAGFVLFRFFDIIKPWPINLLDKSVSDGWGVMLDDLLAAVYAWLVLQSILYFS